MELTVHRKASVGVPAVAAVCGVLVHEKRFVTPVTAPAVETVTKATVGA